MNIRIVQIVLFATLWLTMAKARGATILLHEQAENFGAVIYLGDVADISAATPSEVQDLSTTPLMPAPPKGTQVFLQATQIRELLISRGVDSIEISMIGASVVEVGRGVERAAQVPAQPIPQRSSAEIEQAVVDAIKQYLISQTSHQVWEVEVSLTEANFRRLSKLGFELGASAGRSPWTGSQRFQIAAPGTSEAVLVSARVDRLQNTVIALRNIQQGELIGVADVEVRLQGGNLPSDSFHSLDQVLGKEAIRNISPETILQSGQVRSPLQVQRGETVEVFARTGGIVVKTFAVAKQAGSLGDLVQVETLDRQGKFAARVSGWKQLDVLPTGATAADLATLHRPSQERR